MIQDTLQELSLSDLDVLDREVVKIMSSQNRLKNHNQPFDEELRDSTTRLATQIRREIKRRVEYYISKT